MAVADGLPVEEVSTAHAVEARPGPVGRVLAQARADRIEGHISKGLFEVIVTLDGGRAKPSLEEMTIEAVAVVESPRVSAVQLMHPSGERLTLSLDHQMKVIRHQAIGDVAPAPKANHPVEQTDE
jgi:hypothetical protein